MSFSHYWLQHRTAWQAYPLVGFAFAASFSISISQIFIGIAVAVWLFDWLAQRTFLRSAFAVSSGQQDRQVQANDIVSFRGAAGPADEVPYRMPWFVLFTVFLLWVGYRYVHVPLSSQPLQEFIRTKELLLILIVPMVAFRLPRRRHEHAFYLALLFGAFLTSAFNIYEFIRLDFSHSFRAGAFNSMLTLTYAGIMALVFLVGLGKTLESWRSGEKRLLAVYGVMTFFNFFGFFLAQSGGVTLAMAAGLVLFLLFVFRRKAWLFLPILVIIPVLLVFSSQRVGRLANDVIDGKLPNTILQRTMLWRTGWRVFLDQPILGPGAADLRKSYLAHRPDDITPKYKVAYKGSHMHNDFFDKLVMFGLVGFVLFTAMVVIPIGHWLRWYWRYGRFRSSGWAYWKLYAMGAALFMFPIMGLTQCHFTDDEVVAVYLLVVGLTYREFFLGQYTAKEK